ncbi:Myb-like DNA-binding domain containing protein [Tritrichomonas foetus]|uniref:Myb-like DNA-binding domain containing protein n=1 Tax=Tritrichomonas foetus TaxID=1144522 RepID=A0A1J4L119_9EUKA|nr:Myb-like DNA-binding domain containing protein [Tritrichomonas foetus]|eukprot:OHT17131.1 Myb-like DNA-binding domain containing protein [Tritrichomonas foetus]
MVPPPFRLPIISAPINAINAINTISPSNGMNSGCAINPISKNINPINSINSCNTINNITNSCGINNMNQYMMNYSMLSQQKKSNSVSRHKFSPEEDQKLKDLVAELGESNWNEVSARLGTRTPRQCRERFRNYLSPNLSNDPWTVEDDEKLKAMYVEYGPKWALIATFFPSRSDVNIKNHWAQMNNKSNREHNLQKEKQQLLKQIDIVIEQTKMKAKQSLQPQLNQPPADGTGTPVSPPLSHQANSNLSLNVQEAVYSKSDLTPSNDFSLKFEQEEHKDACLLDWYNLEDSNSLSFFDDNDFESFM